MKRVVLLFILVWTLVAAEFNINSALQKAKITNKPVYVLIISSQCKHCADHLNNTIMPNFKMIQQNYEFALIDVTKEQVPHFLPFNSTTPTTFILAPDGSLLTEAIEGDFAAQYLYKLTNTLAQAYGE